MSKKRKKKSGGSQPVEQPEAAEKGSETTDLSSDASSPRSEKKSKNKGGKGETQPQLTEFEEKMRNMSDKTWFRSAMAITALGAFLRYFLLLLRPVHHDEGVNGWMLTNL